MPPHRSLRRPLTLAAGVSLILCTVPGASLPAVAGPAPAGPVAAAPAVPAAAFTTASVRVSVPSALDAKPFDRARSLEVPRGWTASVWARPSGARLLAFAPDGRLLVSRPGSGKITRLTTDKRGRSTSKTLIKGLRKPHGLAFDGSTLYVAESHRIDRYTYKAGKVGKRHTVLSGLPDASTRELKGQYAHALKSIAVGPDHALYISVGSTGNVSPADRTATPQRAAILRLAPGAKTAKVFARGVRNGTGLAVAPDGAVWSAVNNRDRTAYPYPGKDYGKVMTSYVNDHPLEPLAKLTQGRDLGWPYCNPDPDVDRGSSTTAFDYANQTFVRDVETNADGSKLDCGSLAPVEQGLPAHSAPLGLSFTTLRGLGAGALVGAHGSWNRNPPRAPQVAFFPYANGGLGNQQTLVSGWQASNGDRWGRPVAAVQGPDGAVYVSDDLADTVYRLVPPA